MNDLEDASDINNGILMPSLETGGAETIAIRRAEYFNSIGFVCNIIIYNSSKIGLHTSINVIDLHNDNYNGSIKSLKRINRLFSLVKVVRNYKMELLISFMGNANLYAVLVKLLIGIKVVSSYHTSQFSDKHRGLDANRNVIKFIIYRSDYVVAVSKGIQSDLIEYSPQSNNILTIYNNIQIEPTSVQSQSENLVDFLGDSFCIVCTGRLTHAKGHWILLETINELINEKFDIKLVLIGAGEMEAEISEYIQFNSLRYNVKLCGYLEKPYSYYDLFDVFVSTSLYEGFSLSIGEAALTKIPIISTDCDHGPREILNPNNIDFSDLRLQQSLNYKINGFFISKPVNVHGKAKLIEKNWKVIDELKVRIIFVMNNPSIASKLAERAHNYVKSNYSCLKINQDWDDLLNKLI